MKRKGNIFITIKGNDGVGKLTFVAELTEQLNHLGMSAVFVKSTIGDYQLEVPYVNRKCVVDSHYLFYLAGIKHTSEEIGKEFARHTVVCDRNIYSALAYYQANNTDIHVDVKTLYILEPDNRCYITVKDEDVRRNRIVGWMKTESCDEEIKQTGGLIDRIEKEFVKFDFITIDNINRPLEAVVQENLFIIT